MLSVNLNQVNHCVTCLDCENDHSLVHLLLKPCYQLTSLAADCEFKCKLMEVWQPTSTQRTQILLKFCQKSKDIIHCIFFDYERWAHQAVFVKYILYLMHDSKIISQFKHDKVREICI